MRVAGAAFVEIALGGSRTEMLEAFATCGFAAEEAGGDVVHSLGHERVGDPSLDVTTLAVLHRRVESRPSVDRVSTWRG